MEVLHEGFEFKQAYNKIAQFNMAASDLSALIQQFTDVPIETPVSGNRKKGAAESVAHESPMARSG